MHKCIVKNMTYGENGVQGLTLKYITSATLKKDRKLLKMMALFYMF